MFKRVEHHAYSLIDATATKDFWVRFFMHLKKELILPFEAMRIASISFFAVLLYLSDNFYVKDWLQTFAPLIGVILVTHYLTVIPTYVAIVLIFLPLSFVAPFLGLSVLFSFLYVLAV
jgi:hypothetical protein